MSRKFLLPLHDLPDFFCRTTSDGQLGGANFQTFYGLILTDSGFPGCNIFFVPPF